MFAGFTQRLNFGMGGGTVSIPSAFPTRPIGQLGNFNTYAINFIAATGITASDQQSAINQLSYDLVNTGLMDKMFAIYPFVGGNATKHQYNLKDPRDANAAFRLTFVGGMTHSSSGVQWNGTNGYAWTYLIPNNYYLNGSVTDLSVCLYSGTNNGINTSEISYNNSGIQPNFFFNPRYGDGLAYLAFGQTTYSSVTNNNSLGFFFGNKVNSVTSMWVRTPSNVLTRIINASVANVNFLISGSNGIALGMNPVNNAPATYAYSNRLIQFVTIGRSLTDAQISTFEIIINNFQRNLGRNVY